MHETLALCDTDFTYIYLSYFALIGLLDKYFSFEINSSWPYECIEVRYKAAILCLHIDVDVYTYTIRLTDEYKDLYRPIGSRVII